MKAPSNLPPGVTDAAIERQAGVMPRQAQATRSPFMAHWQALNREMNRAGLPEVLFHDAMNAWRDAVVSALKAKVVNARLAAQQPNTTDRQRGEFMAIAMKAELALDALFRDAYPET